MRIDGPDRLVAGLEVVEEGAKRPAPQVCEHVKFRELTNAHAGNACIDDGMAAVASEPARGPIEQRLAILVELPGGACADDMLVAIEVLNGLDRSAGVEIARRRACQELARRDACADQACVCERAGADGEVITLRHQVDQPVGEIDNDAEARMLVRKTPHQGGQEAFAHSGRAREAELSLGLAFLGDQRDRRVPIVEETLAVAKEHATGVGQAHDARGALKQLCLEPLLQLHDRAADMRR